MDYRKRLCEYLKKIPQCDQEKVSQVENGLGLKIVETYVSCLCGPLEPNEITEQDDEFNDYCGRVCEVLHRYFNNENWYSTGYTHYAIYAEDGTVIFNISDTSNINDHVY